MISRPLIHAACVVAYALGAVPAGAQDVPSELVRGITVRLTTGSVVETGTVPIRRDKGGDSVTSPQETSRQAAAGSKTMTANRGHRKWQVSADLGLGHSSASATLENAFRAARFDDTLYSIIGSAPSPNSTSPIYRTVEIDRTLGRRWSVAALYSLARYGGATGYSSPADQFLDLVHESTTVGALVSLASRAGQVGIGPAWRSVTVRNLDDFTGAGESRNRHQPAFIARGKGTFPSNTRFFLDLRAEYSFAGSMIVGPLTPPALSGKTPLTLPATAVSFNVWFIAVGPGVRF
jgi:hypothetical protein